MNKQNKSPHLQNFGKKDETRGEDGAKASAKPQEDGQAAAKAGVGAGHGQKNANASGWELSDATKPLREFCSSVSPKNKNAKLAGLLAIIFACAYIFSVILGAGLSAMGAFLASILLFLVCGEMMRGLMGWEGFWGLILFKNKSTLAYIDRIAHKYAGIWVALSDIGLVLGYGLFSYLLLGKEQKAPMRLAIMYIGGMALLIVFSVFVAPFAMSVITGMLSGGDFSGASVHLRENFTEFGQVPVGEGTLVVPVFSIAMLFVMILGGLAGSITISLIFYAAITLPAVLGKILAAVVAFATGGEFSADGLPPPGGAPIIPGVNLPFVEGILALSVLLVVHEMAHALLARVANVKLDSAGIVFFGMLPFGAFVEPDEKELEKIEKFKTNRVLVAGSTANLVACMLFFFLFTAAVLATEDLRLGGWKVTEGNLPKGAIVYSVGGMQYSGQNLSFAPGEKIAVMTSFGEFERIANDGGKIGISMSRVEKSALGFRYAFKQGWGWVEFVLNVLSLTFALNMVVGVVNLLPIPLFDGQRLMDAGVGNKRLSLAISIITSAAFLANLLPWIFR